MDQLEEYLVNYFKINSESLDAVAGLFEVKLLDKGDFFLNAGKRCNEMAFVKEGILRISALADGKEITQWIMTEGYFATDLNSFIFGDPGRWNIQALSNSVLYAINKSNYEKIGKMVPNWPSLEREFLVHCFTTMENRVFQFLSMSAEERYHAFFESNKTLFNQVPLQYIASLLGMTPETFSRIRSKGNS